MAFETATKVRFADVDPAGIVFYPRYFEMLNGAVEDWFASMGFDFYRLHLVDKIGTPLVSLSCEFTAPSQLGEELSIFVTIQRVGRTSCAFDFLFRGHDSDRIKGAGVLVCMDLEKKSAIPWPDNLRVQMLQAAVSPQI